MNEIDTNPKLKEFLDGSHTGVTIQDIIETKGVSDEQARLDLLQRRKSGVITRAELREKIKELKQADKAAVDKRTPLRLSVSPTEIRITEAGYGLYGRFKEPNCP